MRFTAAVLACLLLLFCTTALAQGEPEMVVADGAEDNVAVVMSMLEAFGTGDYDAFGGYLADDVRWHFHGPQTAAGVYEPVQGPAAVQALLIAVAENFQDELFEVEQVIAAGDRVVLVGHQVGHFTNGARYDNHFVMIFRLADGLVVTADGYEDTAQVVAGLGG